MSKITINRSVLEQWLEALGGSIAITLKKIDVRNEALATMRKTLAQPSEAPCKYGNTPSTCTSSPMDCQCAIDAALAQPQQEPQTNTDGLLPIDARDHPENHVSLWTETELQAIRDYAARCVAAAISAQPQRNPLFADLIEKHPGLADELAAIDVPQQEPVAAAWREGYQQGIEDERTSEANLGIAGFGAKVKPARQNPYWSSPPARKQMTHDEMFIAIRHLFASEKAARMAVELSEDEYRAIESFHGIKE